jgi:hypothetical protein
MGIKLSVIIAQRGHPEKFEAFMKELRDITETPSSVEVLVVIDDNDTEFLAVYKDIEPRFPDFSLKFYVVPQTDHHSKEYWNFLAKKACGRWIIPVCCDNKIHTQGWDKIICEKMDSASKQFGDDFLIGLTKDNIKRRNEDPVFPNFSCHPVMSRQYVEKMGYMFDERYYTWGTDQAAAILFRKLAEMTGQWRLVSIMDVQIYDYNSMHTTDETDPKKLEKMRLADASYQKHIRIAKEHPCNLQPKDYEIEARKIMGFIS